MRAPSVAVRLGWGSGLPPEEFGFCGRRPGVAGRGGGGRTLWRCGCWGAHVAGLWGLGLRAGGVVLARGWMGDDGLEGTEGDSGD